MNNCPNYFHALALTAFMALSPLGLTPAVAETSAADVLAPGMAQEEPETSDTNDTGNDSEQQQTQDNTENQAATQEQAAAAEQAASSAEQAPQAAEPAAPEAAPAPEKKEPEPVTTEDLEIPADELKLLIKPFSTEELTTEAGGWFAALQTKAKEVVDVELKVKRLNKKQLLITEQLEALEEKETPEQGSSDSDTTDKKEASDTADEELTPEEQQEAAKALILELNPEAETDSLDSPDAIKEALGAFSGGLDEKKEELAEEGAKLREQRTALIDKLNVVLDSINATDGIKADGTDNDIVVPFRRYITTITGLNIDLNDAQSTKKVIKKWIFSKDGGKRWLTNIALFFGILIGFWFLSIILGAIVNRAVKATKNSSTLLRNFLVGIVKKATMIIGIVMALAALEINVSPLLAALGAAGFILAFALQGTLSNFASGILMMVYRPFDIGDSIEAGGASGSVESMNLVSTHIKTADNQRMVVPNNAVWGGTITNGSNTSRRRVDMSFTVDNSDNADTVRERLEKIVTSHPKVLQDPAPVVRLDELTDGGMKFVVLPWSMTGDAGDVKWDVTREVKRLFDNKELNMPDAG